MQLVALPGDHEPAGHDVGALMPTDAQAAPLGQGWHALALVAADHVPAGQAEHTVLDVAEQFTERKEPAPHASEAQAAQGGKPVTDHVAPLTHDACVQDEVPALHA